MTSLETLQSAISNVSVWRQGDVCAPHKPLLLLYVLSQYKAGHPRLFNYGLEIHEPLTRLLKEFGPKRRTDYPNMPFWRLRTDGFWEIANAEGCKPRRGNTQPTKKELIDNQVAGGFDETAYQQLLAHPEVIDQLAQQILMDRFPESIQRILANQLGLDENLTIRISGGVSRSPVVDNLFWQRNGQQLHLPHDKSLWPTEQYVGWHRKQIFKA